MTGDLIFLGEALVIVAVPFALSRSLRLNGVVPLVVVQILVGIALGPSLLGRLAPDWYRLLFNSASLAPLSGIASLAVLFFGFITGLHLDPRTFRGQSRAFAWVAAASVVVPTVSGFGAGLWIALRHPEQLGLRISPLEFAAAIGVCIGVTALPVLGAVLREMNLLGRRIGDFALGIAAVNDASLWILLGLLLTTVAGQALEAPDVVTTLLALPAYLLVMACVVRPLLRRIITDSIRDRRLSEGGLIIVCAVTIGSALVTEMLGLHYILGAFIAGVVTPYELRQPILDRLQAMTVTVLMPFFFALTGLRTEIDPTSSTFLEIFGLTTAIAMATKIGGTSLAARMVGESWPFALGLGALVQTKGLMEVIVLSILVDAKIISSSVFSALILMAVVSTAFAMPIARMALARDGRKGTREGNAASHAASPAPGR